MKDYPGLLIANLGSLKFSQNYGNLKLEKLYFSPSSIPTPDGGLIIGVVSMNNKLSITLNFMVKADKNNYLNLMNEINSTAVRFLLNKIHIPARLCKKRC